MSVLPKIVLQKEFGLAGKLMILDEGEGYFLRAIRTLVGSTLIIVIDWQHPNYGYFADAMVFIKLWHMDDWMVIPIVSWSQNYHSAEDFLQDYPMLEPMFTENDVSTILEDLFSVAGD